MAIIHQELSLFPNLSVADNVFMARERVRSGVIVDHSASARVTAKLMERLESRSTRDSGRRAARRSAADRRDRQRAGAGRARADHGRADVGAQRGRGRRAVPRHPRADRGRRGDRLHLPPSRRGARDRRPCRRLRDGGWSPRPRPRTSTRLDRREDGRAQPGRALPRTSMPRPTRPGSRSTGSASPTRSTPAG